MGTDPFDEFEFKPLTDGLGFHQKPAKTATATPTAALSGMDFTEEPAANNPFKTTLPRKEGVSTKSAPTPTAPKNSPVDDILQTLQQNRKFEIELDRKHRQELRQPKTNETWKLAKPSLAAVFLDGMLITAAGLLCMIVMLTITKVDLIRNLSNPDTEGLVYAATFALFAGVAFIYMVMNRVFLGFTPGEWAYDIRLGRPDEQGKGMYAIQVLFRQALVTITGLITLPLIGAVLGKDISGKIAGLSLMRKA